MTAYLNLLTLCLLLTLFAGFKRMISGPTAADRMLTAQLCSTTVVAMILLLAYALDGAYLPRVALVLALLALVTLVAFIRLYWGLYIEGPDDA